MVYFMFKRHYSLFDIEKSNKFVDRIIFLSLPSALVFILLAVFNFISPLSAIVSYAVILIFNTILLFPITFELQQLRKYISSLAQGESVDGQNIQLSEKETKEIVEAVNAMHRFWAQKADNLEAQSISDAAVLDTLPDPIMMIDRSGNILGANLSSRTLWGDNITDLNVENLFDSNIFIDAQKLYAHIKQLPWQSKGRAVAVISFYDLTKAMKIEKMQSDFVANASHELRTPLAIISGFIETLLTSAKGDEAAQEHFLKIMQDQAVYMSELIENLLSLSKIELTQDQRPDGKVNIAKIIEDVQNALSLKAAEREITIKTDVESGIGIITADEHQVKQVIQNLTDNAIKYGLSNSDITIKAYLSDSIPGSKSTHVAIGKAVAISINNKGPKISAENMARLTERFYRMQEHKDLNIRGSGLGLSIAKQIIIRHRGNLTVTSTSFGGTTFTIYLPCEQNSQ